MFTKCELTFNWISIHQHFIYNIEIYSIPSMNAQKLRQLTFRTQQNPHITMHTQPVTPCQIPIPISPILSRTNSSLKNLKKKSTQKSKKQKQFQLEIRYAKSPRKQLKIDDSINHSDYACYFGHKIQDSQETVHKNRNYSRDRLKPSDCKRERSGQKTGEMILLDVSGVSNSFKRSRINDKNNDDYYTYWKAKAHQYLEANMKLMEQVRRITKENEELNKLVEKYKSLEKIQANKKEIKMFDQKELNQQVLNISGLYIKKIEEMEKELKRKEVVIGSYEIKLNDLSSKAVGDVERIKLMSKMREQLQCLRQQNHQLSMQLSKDSNCSTDFSALLTSQSKTTTNTNGK